MNLTENQRRAVETRGRDVVVTAGAGSGKTRVLVERYVSLLEDHDIDQLVAVTFTDAAAAEMRGRVREAVMSRPELARHKQHLDTAVIGTIHSLCLQMLRENPVEAGIDPAAAVLGEDEAQMELLGACRDAVEAAAAGEGPGVDALLGLGVFSAQSALPRMVERRDEVEQAYAALDGDTAAEWGVHLRLLLANYVDQKLAVLRRELVERLSWLDKVRNPDETDALTPLADWVAETIGDPLEGDSEDLLHRLLNASFMGTVRGGSAKAWSASTQAVRGALSAIKNMYGEVAPFIWNDADTDALPVLESLRGLFRGARDRYEARKRELSALDFLDLELKAIELLRASPGTAAGYRSRFRHVLVDEAQDLNPTQFEFLKLLTDGDAESGGRPPEQFFVGDVKQSIFRFRRSDVRNLNRLTADVGRDEGEIISLDTSFRSHPDLVGALNAVMEDVLGQGLEEYEARMEAMSSARPSRPGAPFVEVMPIAREYADSGQDGRPSDSEKRRMEAHMIAGRIRELVDGGYRVWDKDMNDYRPAAPGDIVILIRRMSHVDEYERALESQGVPYRTASGGGFYNRAEIIDLANLLEWLAEPANDIALVGLLRSLFFAIDDESLVALTQADGTLLDALGNPSDGVLPQTRPLCVHAARVLEQLREESRLASPEQLVERALVLTNYEASWAPLRGGEQVLANIRQFAGMARAAADKTVDEFVEHIRALRDDLDIRAPQAAPDAGDAARLLTIHSAKGLEFPIVFLADAGPTQGGPRSSAVLWRAEEGISLTLEREVGDDETGRRQPAFHNYLRALEQREEEAENKRLLYVAATRAADLLTVSGSLAANETRATWLNDFSNPAHAGHTHVHAPVGVDMASIRSRAPRSPFTVPPAESEQEADAPLIGRRGAIPIRSSTPATALERHEQRFGGGASDPLALIRGTVAHAAIEEWFKVGARPDAAALADRLGARLSDEDLANIAADVDGMLDDFDTSELAATLRDSATRKHFELPFSWAWDGVAVHGSIDLAYEAGGEWRVVDFKTDRVEEGGEAERAAAYLTQLGVYAGAIEAATGRRPAAGLLFLRTGKLWWATGAEIEDALRETRGRIDAGDVSVGESDENGEFADEALISPA